MKCKLKIIPSRIGIELFKWNDYVYDWRLIIRTNCWVEGYTKNCKQTRLSKFLSRVTENTGP